MLENNRPHDMATRLYLYYMTCWKVWGLLTAISEGRSGGLSSTNTRAFYYWWCEAMKRLIKNMRACSSLESWPSTTQNVHLFFMRYWRHDRPRKGKEKSQKNAMVKNLKGRNYNVKSLERTYEDNNGCSPHNARDVLFLGYTENLRGN